MLGKLNYEQVDSIIQLIDNSTNDLRQVLGKYNNGDALSVKAVKLLDFCGELDKYCENLKSKVQLNKDAEIVVNRLVGSE